MVYEDGGDKLQNLTAEMRDQGLLIAVTIFFEVNTFFDAVIAFSKRILLKAYSISSAAVGIVIPPSYRSNTESSSSV